MANAPQPSRGIAVLRPLVPLLLLAPHPRTIPKKPSVWALALRKRRTELGLTQAEAALRLRVRKVTLAEWEAGVAEPGEDKCPAVLAFLSYEPSAMEPG
jgi:DNA-binding XRE family transcriptional regulator